LIDEDSRVNTLTAETILSLTQGPRTVHPGGLKENKKGNFFVELVMFNYTDNTGNRLSQIVAASRTYGFTHDLAGQRSGLTDPNGVTTTYTYTPAGYLSSLLARNSQQVTIDSFAYNHDALGLRTSLTDLGGLHTYQYDDVYQLTQATHPTPSTEQLSYDPVGNRLGTVVDLNNALLEDSEFTYSYDYNDNLIQKIKKSNGEITTFTYDYENRHPRVQYPGMDAQYKYDALGRRIEKNVNGQVTTYVYDGLNMVTDYTGLWTVRSKYVFGQGLDEPLSVDQGDSPYYYHQDGLGSFNELTDASRNVARIYRYDLDSKMLYWNFRSWNEVC
jgi:YD repeat-containing protein